jgi:RHS repeat-associated protein
VSVTNALGAFIPSYNGGTEVITAISNPNNTRVEFAYFPSANLAHRDRLQTLTHTKVGGPVISRSDFTYNVNGQIATLQQQLDTAAPEVFELAYDKVDQLLSAVKKTTGGSPTVLKQFDFAYDALGNRRFTRLTVPGGAPAETSLTYSNNNLNQLVRRTDKTVKFIGTVSDNVTPGANVEVTINGAKAIRSGASFEGHAIAENNHVVTVKATDVAGNTRTTNYRLKNQTATGEDKVHTYDLNGNLISVVTTSGAGTSSELYEWDAAYRLAATERRNGSALLSRSEFVYDGLGRRVEIREKNSSGVVTSTKRFVWVGNDLCEERDAGGAVTRQFFPQGEMRGVTKYFYTRDHLGSVREVLDTSGNTVARYDYDPYGVRSQLSGTFVCDFGFTGHYLHQPSALYLALFRAYDPVTGRWISRDPIGELGGINLYLYAANDPFNLIDPYGLDWTENAIINALTHPSVVNFFAGLGDGVSFGLTDKFRDTYGLNDQVDKCAGLYKGGLVAGTALGASIPGGQVARAAGGANRVVFGTAKSGLYKFAGHSGRGYVGQSGNVARRLSQHGRTGKLPSGNRVVTYEVKGGKLARERAEQQMINRHGGLNNLENKVNPLGGRPELYHYVPTVGEAAAGAAGVGAGIGARRAAGCP